MLKTISGLILLTCSAGASAQLHMAPPAPAVHEEWVLVLQPAVAGTTTIASQRFATEADCKALATQISPNARCLKAKIITQ